MPPPAAALARPRPRRPLRARPLRPRPPPLAPTWRFGNVFVLPFRGKREAGMEARATWDGAAGGA